MARRISLASLTLIPHVKLSLSRCAVMVSSRRARSVTLVRVTTQRAVIHGLASSRPELCATQVVRLAARVIVSLHRERSHAGSPGTIGVICPSFVPVTRQHVPRISLSRTVRASRSSNSGCFHNSSRPELWCWKVSVCQWHLHIVGLYDPFTLYAFAWNTDSPSVQCQSAGSTLGLTKACPARNDRSCQVSCQDPGTANQCVVLQTQLVDGSPCGACAFVYGDETAADVGVA